MSYLPRRVSQAEQDKIHAIAARTEAVLREAGLPMNDNAGGVDIEIDTFEGPCGVYVDWNVSSAWLEEVRPRVLAGDANDPRYRQLTTVDAAMRTAITAVLGAAGLTVQESDDDLRPLVLKVTG